MSLQDVSLSSDENESDVVLVPPAHQSMKDIPDQQLVQVHYQLGFMQNSLEAAHADIISLRHTVNQLTDLNMQMTKQINHIDKNLTHMSRSYEFTKEEVKACKKKLFISAIIVAAATIFRWNR